MASHLRPGIVKSRVVKNGKSAQSFVFASKHTRLRRTIAAATFVLRLSLSWPVVQGAIVARVTAVHERFFVEWAVSLEACDRSLWTQPVVHLFLTPSVLGTEFVGAFF